MAAPRDTRACARIGVTSVVKPRFSVWAAIDTRSLVGPNSKLNSEPSASDRELFSDRVPTLAPGESVPPTATVTAPSGISDPNLANNTATDTDAITVKADLKVTVTDGKTSAVAGSKNTYTIVVTNAGPSKVSGAVIRAYS